MNSHRIVIVGGGAAGLALATRLGRRLTKRGRAEVTLIDAAKTHIWKPLLHEVAAGTLDSHQDELEYLAQARYGQFRFRLGSVDQIDRDARWVEVAPTLNEQGEEIIPRRRFRYDTLVFAVGSISNDFGIPGVAEHCWFLDNTAQAERFQRQLLETLLKAHTRGGPQREGQLHVAIVGAGATGVELAAQLHAVARQLAAYGLDEIVPERDIKIRVIEAADRILPALPPHLSEATTQQLNRLGIDVLTGERVVEVGEEGFKTASGELIRAGVKVWAAGIKAPEFLAALPGLEQTRNNQLVVGPTLQTTVDQNIFAIGDCAACPLPDGSWVPPRAQAASQQSDLLVRSLSRRLEGASLPTFRYRDYGSLVSLGNYSTVGNLMGNLLGSVRIEGVMARMVYLALYKKHQLALFGWYRVLLLTLSHLFRRAVHPSVKLH